MKKLSLHKPESQRTKKEKKVRNCVFFCLVAYVALLTGLLLNAEINEANAESDLVMSSIVMQQTLSNVK
jgi:hypothetical protein